MLEKKEIIFLMPSLKMGGGNLVFVKLAEAISSTQSVCIIAPNTGINHFEKIGKKDKITVDIVGITPNFLFQKVINMYKACSKAFLKKNATIIYSDPILATILLFVNHGNNKEIWRFIQADDFNIYNDGYVLKLKLLVRLYKKLCIITFQKKINFIFNSNFSYLQFKKVSNRMDVAPKIVTPAIDNLMNEIFREKIGEAHRFTIGVIARKHPLKGFQDFIDAIDKLSRSDLEKIKKILIYTPDNMNGFKNHPLFNYITNTFEYSIWKFYESVDIFVSSSWSEGFGMPPLEAMRKGCIVITSKSGGVNEFAQHGKNCLMFEPKNTNQLADALQCILNQKVSLNNLIDQAIATASQFTWENSGEELLKIFRKEP